MPPRKHRASLRPEKLTKAVIDTIAAYVRGGGFPHVAAQAAGLTAEEMDRHMALGKRLRHGTSHKGHAPSVSLYNAVTQAAAVARLLAEAQVMKEDPLAWLTRGPGRDSADAAGWTVPVKPTSRTAPEQVTVVVAGREQELDLPALLRLLGPYPEARKAVAAALAAAACGPPPGALRVGGSTCTIVPAAPGATSPAKSAASPA